MALTYCIYCITQTQQVILTSTQLGLLNFGHKHLASAQQTSDTIVTLLVWRPAPLYIGKPPQPLCYDIIREFQHLHPHISYNYTNTSHMYYSNQLCWPCYTTILYGGGHSMLVSQ